MLLWICTFTRGAHLHFTFNDESIPRNKSIPRIVCRRWKVFKGQGNSSRIRFSGSPGDEISPLYGGGGSLRVYLQNFLPRDTRRSRNRFLRRRYRCPRDGGGKYIMSLVKLSFYDHFMVARDPSMLSTYRCAFLTAAPGARADSSRISFIIRVGRTL